MRKIFALLLVCTLVIGMSVPVYAAEVAPMHAVPVTPTYETAAVSPRAYNIPTSEHDLPYNAVITNLEEGHFTYTAYYFSPVDEKLLIAGTLYPCGTEDGAARKAKINLYKVGSSDIVDSYTTASFTVSEGVVKTFRNLDDDAFYYLTIENLTSATLTAERWIEGGILIYNE